MEYSAKIDLFFSKEKGRDGLWDFAHDYQRKNAGFFDCGIWDASWWSGDGRLRGVIEPAFNHGCELARKAESLSKPVYHFTRDDNGYYFIGEEPEIMKTLEDGWAAWLKKYPPKTEEEIEEEEKAREKDKLRQELNKIKEKLKHLS